MTELRGEGELCTPSSADDERLFALVYENLRQRAGSLLRHERPGHTLQTTALVHEAWLKLQASEDSGVTRADQSYVLGVAARAMRQILIDHARARQTQKRAGTQRSESLTESSWLDSGDGLDLLAVDEALEKLRARSERLARVVELRFFGGLSIETIAEVLSVDRATVGRDWRAAKALLSYLLRDE